jgi:hypothetical protein
MRVEDDVCSSFSGRFSWGVANSREDEYIESKLDGVSRPVQASSKALMECSFMRHTILNRSALQPTHLWEFVVYSSLHISFV